MEILWKGTVSAQFPANRPELCGNCGFPQNFHTRKLGKIAVFVAVYLKDNVYINVNINVDDDVNADVDAEMPKPRFLNGRF